MKSLTSPETQAALEGLDATEQLCVMAYFASGFRMDRAGIEAGLATEKQESIRVVRGILHRPHVMKAFMTLHDMQINRFEITTEKILGELAKMAFSNVGRMVRKNKDGGLNVDFANADDDDFAAIQSVSVTERLEKEGEDFYPVKDTSFKMYDKQSALLNLLKYQTAKDALEAAAGDSDNGVEFTLKIGDEERVTITVAGKRPESAPGDNAKDMGEVVELQPSFVTHATDEKADGGDN